MTTDDIDKLRAELERARSLDTDHPRSETMTTLVDMLEALLERAATHDGHVYLTRLQLHAEMVRLVDTALQVGALNHRLVLHGEPGASDQRVYLPRLDAAERMVSESVKRMLVRS